MVEKGKSLSKNSGEDQQAGETLAYAAAVWWDAITVTCFGNPSL